NSAGMVTAPHADSRSLLFGTNAGNDFLLETDDGGIYFLDRPENAAVRNWTSKIGNLRITEVYSVAYDRVNDVFFVGAQDVSSSEQISSGPNSGWHNARIGGMDDHMRGDGQGQAFVVQGGQPHRFSMGNNFAALYDRQFNASNTLTNSEPANRVKLSGLNKADKKVISNGSFVDIPFVFNPADPVRMAIGYNGLYESSNSGASITEIKNLPNRPKKSVITAIAYGTAAAPDVLYVAYGDVIGVRDQKATPAALGAALDRGTVVKAGEAIGDIVINPDD